LLQKWGLALSPQNIRDSLGSRRLQIEVAFITIFCVNIYTYVFNKEVSNCQQKQDQRKICLP
jgi:hypothetical protein